MMLSASRRVSGFVTFTSGEFYGGTLVEASWRGRVEMSPQLSAEPTLSLNHVDTPYGMGDTNVIGGRATYTMTPRMFVGALVQYQSATKTVDHQRAVPLGIPAWQRDVRRLQRRPRHRPHRLSAAHPESKFRREGHQAVPTLKVRALCRARERQGAGSTLSITLSSSSVST